MRSMSLGTGEEHKKKKKWNCAEYFLLTKRNKKKTLHQNTLNAFHFYSLPSGWGTKKKCKKQMQTTRHACKRLRQLHFGLVNNTLCLRLQNNANHIFLPMSSAFSLWHLKVAPRSQRIRSHDRIFPRCGMIKFRWKRLETQISIAQKQVWVKT